MSDERFDVKFWGEIQPDKDMEAVKAAMAGLFRLSAEQTERLFSGQQLTVARDADGARANRLKAAIEQAGGVCALLPCGVWAAPAPPAQVEPPPEPPVAPEPEPPVAPEPEPPAPPELESDITPTLESDAPSMPTATFWAALEADTPPMDEPGPAPLPETDEPPAPEPPRTPIAPPEVAVEPPYRPRPRKETGRRTGPDWLAILVAVLALLVALAVAYVALFRPQDSPRSDLREGTPRAVVLAQEPHRSGDA
jgi:hypothetical protein